MIHGPINTQKKYLYCNTGTLKHISQCGVLGRLNSVYNSVQLQRFLKNRATETPRTDIGAGQDTGDLKEER